MIVKVKTSWWDYDCMSGYTVYYTFTSASTHRMYDRWIRTRPVLFIPFNSHLSSIYAKGVKSLVLSISRSNIKGSRTYLMKEGRGYDA
jgi:hypothetical protein